MSRYFYILCLLVIIDWTFCYDYISDRNPQIKHGRRLSKKVKSQRPKQGTRQDVNKKHQEYDSIEDKDPVAQIDVASFIQKPDDYAVDNNIPYEMDNRRKTKLGYENDYKSLLGYNPEPEYIKKRSNRRPYYSNPNPDNSFDLGPNPLLLKDSINSRHLNLDSLSPHGLYKDKIARNLDSQPFNTYEADNHKSEKKSVLKHVKFPFFSHNKTDSPKSKKEKKRKVFCFSCSKKENKPNTVATNDFGETAKKESVETLRDIAMDSPDYTDQLKMNIKRGKRDEWTNASDRERQLKELEEIQKKVDSVEITSSFQKTP